MGNYIGYFRSNKDVLYSVKFIATTKAEFTEIILSSRPFEVTYQNSKTPFEPIRTSTATIGIIHNNYLEDLLKPSAQGTRVILTNEDTNTTEWVGFLTPKIYDQEYYNEYDEIEFEAADCISSLQYIDYKEVNGRGTVSFKQIIEMCCNSAQQLTGYYWTRSKRLNNNVLTPDMLHIAEQNFFSNDTDEPWKLQDVLKEICNYLGFTCMQYKDRMYFIDYQSLRTDSKIYATLFLKSANYASGGNHYLGDPYTVTADSFMGNDASISFEPVYNKVTVKDNMYNCEEFFPKIFGDENLTNRNGDFYSNFEVLPEEPTVPSYPKGGFIWQSWKDDANDADYRYFYRLYDNEGWESLYLNEQRQSVTLTKDELKSVACTRNYVGGTIVDLGVVKKVYIDEYQQYQVPNKLDYTRYLCISQKGVGYYASSINIPVFRTKPNFKSRCLTSDKSYLIIKCSAIWEKYRNRAYINPDWTSTAPQDIRGGNFYEDGDLYFRLKIGDKYWSGKNWETQERSFSIAMERTTDEIGLYNSERRTLNNVSWDMYINEEGYKIPLADVDVTQDCSFEIMLPSLQWRMTVPPDTEWNQYCWIKDLSIKVVEESQDIEVEDSDVKYENVIDDNAVNELSDITLKVTTHLDKIKPSYSNVMTNINGKMEFLQGIHEPAITDAAQKPEENIIEKYVLQYNTKTEKLNLVLDKDINPFQKIVGADALNPSKNFVQLGTTIDYMYDSQEITIVEKK